MSFERKKADSVVSALETAVRKGRAVEYVKGFSSERDKMTEEDLKQACEAAAGADVVSSLPDCRTALSRKDMTEHPWNCQSVRIAL